MIRSREVWFVCGFLVAFVLFAGSATAITLPELASRVENMNRSEREALLIKGAKEEKEVMFYGTNSRREALRARLVRPKRPMVHDVHAHHRAHV